MIALAAGSLAFLGGLLAGIALGRKHGRAEGQAIAYRSVGYRLQFGRWPS